MSGALAEFKELLDKRSKGQIVINTEWATVKDVDWDDKTMTCIGQNNELEYFDILLGLGSMYKKPKIGTMALIGAIDNSEETFMIDCEEFEEIIFSAGKTKFKINTEGYIINQGDENLKVIFNDLIAEIIKLNQEVQNIVVSAGVSPNVPILQQIVQSTNAVKQRLNTVLIE